MRRSLILFIIVACTMPTWAASSQTRTTGELLVGITPRSIAMGETGLIGSTSPLDALANPAQYALFGKGLRFEVTGMVPQNIESRSFPIYDSFDGILNYNQYVSNSMGNAKFAAGGVFTMKSESGKIWTVALATKPLVDYDYKYYEEIRDRFSTGGQQDRVLGRVEDKTDGTRRWTGIAVAAPVWKSLTAGISVGMVSGSIESKSVFSRDLPSDSTGIIEMTSDPDNAQLESRLGFTYQINDRLSTGLQVTHRGDWNDKVTIDTTTATYHSNTSFIVNRTYPMSIGAGFEYLPGQMLRSRFLAEIEWTNWKEATLSSVPQNLENTLEFRVGVEHRVLPEVPVRFGYRYSPSPFDKEYALSYLSVGTGYDHGAWATDFALQFGHLKSKGADPVADNLFGGLPRNDMDNVQDRYFRFAFGVSYKFGQE
ncbi:MAG: outer membrane protein transport protein [bacterium]|nr:outer membrane protein transport protein [bacterium]